LDVRFAAAIWQQLSRAKINIPQSSLSRAFSCFVNHYETIQMNNLQFKFSYLLNLAKENHEKLLGSRNPPSLLNRLNYGII
jgi:hypothetical protein